ncbi:hypothetical protein GPS45_14655 [Acinetobacter haemolyticus]|nr:hypothetical protein [Acinetobacter haemolyticus]
MFITSFGEQNITYKCCSNFLIHLCNIRMKQLFYIDYECIGTIPLFSLLKGFLY